MKPGRAYNKDQTTIEGTNLDNSATQSYKHVEIPTYVATTGNNNDYQGEDDSQKVLTGAGGNMTMGEPEKSPHRWGHVTPSGSRLEINDTGGSETITIVHRSGAGISMEADGSVFIHSQSQRGSGLSAPFGDVFISSGGDVVIKGSASLTVETAGDATFDVGGMFNLKCEDFRLTTKNYTGIIDGAHNVNITNDSSVIIGGLDRKTVAGDSREQISRNKIVDVGVDLTTRIGGKRITNIVSDNTLIIGGGSTESIKGDFKSTIGGSSDTSVKSNHTEAIGGESTYSANGEMTLTTGSTLNLSASSELNAYGGSGVKVTSGSGLDFNASGGLKLTGTSVHSNPPIDLAKWSEEAQQAGQASTLGGSLGSKPSPQSASSASSKDVKSTGEALEVKDAEVMDSNDILDNLTSARKYPEYYGNGVLESANSTGLGMSSHDEDPSSHGVFNEYSGGNYGNANPSYQADVYENLSPDPYNRDPNISINSDGIDIPGYGNLHAKISKYFTMGMLINGTTTRVRPSKSQWDKVAREAVLLAKFVLDPIKERFPDLLITSWYRPGTKNHGTGRAIDVVVNSRDMPKHAEIARFARDSLPVDQVLLERNNSGRTHVHLRVSQPGWTGTPTVSTCGDPKCYSSVPGIQVAWLARRAK